MLETHICIGMKGCQVIWGMHAHRTHVAPKMLQYFNNKPAEDQDQGVQDLVFYIEKRLMKSRC